MKYIGIDFGTKKSGLAVSDDNGSVAVPWKIVETEQLMREISKMLEDKRFERIVIGESVNQKGEHNPVYTVAREFIDELKRKYEFEINGGLLSIFWEKEFMTSKHARAEDGKAEVDDRAAALILQRFLDKENKKEKKKLQKNFEEKEEEYFKEEGE